MWCAFHKRIYVIINNNAKLFVFVYYWLTLNILRHVQNKTKNANKKKICNMMEKEIKI